MNRRWGARSLALAGSVAVGACASPPPVRALEPGAELRGDFAAAPLVVALGPGRFRITLEVEGVDGALVVGGDVVDRLSAASGAERDDRAFERATVIEARRAHAGTSTGTFVLRAEALPAGDPRLEAAVRLREADAERRSFDAATRRRALGRLREAARRFHDALDPAMAAQAGLLAGRLALALGEPDPGDFAAALPDGEPTVVALLRIELSEVAARRGRLDDAARELAAVRAPRNDPLVGARQALSEADALARNDRSLEALARLRGARAAAVRAGDDALETEVEAAIGWCHERLGDRARTLAAFEASLAAAERAGDPMTLGLALHNRGVFASNFDRDWSEGLVWYLRAVELRRRSGDVLGLAYSLDGAGEMESTLGERAALERHAEALVLRRAVGDLRGEAQTLMSLGNARRRLGALDTAAAPLIEGTELMRRLGDRDWEGYGDFSLARVAHLRGDDAEAVTWIERALELTESLRERLAGDEARAYYSGSVRDYFDQYVAAAASEARRTGERRWIATTLRASEQARARALLDMINLIDVARPTGTPAQRAEQAALRARVRRLELEQTQARQRQADADELASRDREIEAALASYERLLVAIDAADPDAARLRRPTLVDLDAATKMADQETLIVEWYLGAGGAFAVVIGTSTAAVYALGPQDALAADAVRLHAEVAARNSAVEGEDATARAQRIRGADAAVAQLVVRLRDRLTSGFGARVAAHRRLVLVADGPLHYVPFGALWPEHEVVTLPSLTVLHAQRQRRRAPPTRSLSIIGDPSDGDAPPEGGPRDLGTAAPPDQSGAPGPRGEDAVVAPGLAPLAHAREEIGAIAALVPTARVYRGRDATKARVTSGTLAPFALVHFATHGVLDADRPERSGLVLSSTAPADRFLALPDVYALELRADLVVLSACDTALGREIRGEGLIGLTRGFLYAGARAVLASLWKVDDRATARLMVAFYRGLLERRLSAPAALRAAQQAVASDPEYRAPYHWAGFVLQGDWARPVRVPRP